MRRTLMVGPVMAAALAVSAGFAAPVAAPAPQQAAQATSPGHITAPVEALGHNFGDDYFVADYEQIAGYWHTLARESPRITVQSIGKTAEGRDQFMAIVTSPENQRQLAKYKDISRRLALAQGLTDDEARALAREGKAVVWIDGGLHASESLGAQQLAAMVYRMVSRDDEETRRILDNVIILFVHANPDGNDLVAHWYMRNPVPEQRTLGGLPRLYQKYIGHDNNRDFFASTQAETENMNRVLYREWFPQILYNHHQSGPAGTVLYSPPLRDPFNYNEDPLVVLGIEQIGNAIHTRLAAEGKPGATMRTGGPYDGWWNGGIRNTAVFHNTIAILTEMIGSPTPMRVPLVLNRQLPTSDLTYPIAPQPWHFRQSVDYSISCDLAVLDLASKMKENFLYNRYVMGKRSIEKGSEDTWTVRPHRMEAIATAVRGPGGAAPSGRGGGRGGRGGRGNAEADAALWAALHRPADRDPRGYILPSDQRDFPTATAFVNALLENGITVERATREFTVAGKTYPKGSYVVMTAQAFRPHIMDMFEPQDHPDTFPVPGGPPQRPYDNAGWTLAYQMGVQFDRILDDFSGPFESVGDWDISPAPGRIAGPTSNVTAYVLGSQNPSRTSNAPGVPLQLNTFNAVNRLLAAGENVFHVGGSFVVTAKATTKTLIDRAVTDLGIDVVAEDGPAPSVPKLQAPRIGLWDQYGGSIESGWLRWILEQFEFKYTRVFAPELDRGNLNANYDVLIFAGGAIPGTGGGRGGRGSGRGGGRGGGPNPADVPAEYRDEIGRMTTATTVPQIRQFLENGGTVIALGTSAMNLAQDLELPIENHLTENGMPLPSSKYYVPGSVLEARVDPSEPAAYGMQAHTDFFFDNNPVMKLGPDAAARGITRIAWFDSKTPLRSGWAWGQQYLDGGVIAAEAPVGKGRLLLYTAEIIQRAQPYGTFRLLFNGIYR